MTRSTDLFKFSNLFRKCWYQVLNQGRYCVASNRNLGRRKSSGLGVR